MKRSTSRILTSHAGSLPRPADLIEMIRDDQAGKPVDTAAFQARVKSAVAETVQKQIEAGVDILSDGEEGKPSYATYVKDRLTGFGGSTGPIIPANVGEAVDYPEFQVRRNAATPTLLNRPACNGPIAWKDFGAVERDIENLKAATAGTAQEEVFMTAASPGVVAFFLGNEYYPSHEAYIEAVANVMKDEYEAIYKAGFLLQLDCPDLAMSRHSRFAHLSTPEFRSLAATHIEVLNEATKNIPGESMRLHLCWGNYEGPHHLDIEMKDLADVVLHTKCNAISFEGANPRHAHEWAYWKENKLPDEKVLVPGVIDSTTNFIEHPELVAQRILNYTNAVGRERVIASVDCGFGTNAASTTVDARIAWAKLKSLSDGAAIASRELW
jgi:5-methyltetrahydropteroyltriglutamate--homocysteine methyltransferase